MRFVALIDTDGTGVVGIDIGVTDPDSVIARTKSNDIPVIDGKPQIGGVLFTLVKA